MVLILNEIGFSQHDTFFYEMLWLARIGARRCLKIRKFGSDFLFQSEPEVLFHYSASKKTYPIRLSPPAMIDAIGLNQIILSRRAIRMIYIDFSGIFTMVNHVQKGGFFPDFVFERFKLFTFKSVHSKV